MFVACIYKEIIDVIFLLIAKYHIATTRYGLWYFIFFATYTAGQAILMGMITVMGLKMMAAKPTEGTHDAGHVDEEDHTEKLN